MDVRGTEGAPDFLYWEASGLKGRSVLGDLFWSCVCILNSLFLLRLYDIDQKITQLYNSFFSCTSDKIEKTETAHLQE